MYEIEFSQTAAKQFSKLSKDVQIRIMSTLERIQVRPFHHVERLVNSSYYRLRVGEYRVILDIKPEKVLILVVEVGHRRNIYNEF